jgi:hypothetical protein
MTNPGAIHLLVEEKRSLFVENLTWKGEYRPVPICTGRQELIVDRELEYKVIRTKCWHGGVNILWCRWTWNPRYVTCKNCLHAMERCEEKS